MRQSRQDLLNTAVFGLLALENAGFQGYNLAIVTVGALAGVIAGASNVWTETRMIENKGQYRPRLLTFLVLTTITISIVSISFYAAVVRIIPISYWLSGLAFVPALFLGRFLARWRWESRTGREIYSFGSRRALGTSYAAPRGMTWAERMNYASEQRELLQKAKKV